MIINKKYVLAFLFIISGQVFTQTDWVRWEKSNPTYQIKIDVSSRELDLSIESPSDIVVKPLINAYWFFVSDVDGVNCPFHPSCSNFFVQSVNETNIVQGTIMFFDRFTRDTNIFDRKYHYPHYGTYQYYDPITNYLLDELSINFIPSSTFLNQ